MPKSDLDRYQTLLKQDAIPKQQLDTQVALVAQYEGNIKTDQANIDNAKLQLTYAKITAPISGRIGLRLVDPGNIVHAADTTGLLLITQLQPIAALFTIPEDSLPQVLKKLRAGATCRSMLTIATRPRNWVPAAWRPSTTRSIRQPALPSSKPFSITPTTRCSPTSS